MKPIHLMLFVFAISCGWLYSGTDGIVLAIAIASGLIIFCDITSKAFK